MELYILQVDKRKSESKGLTRRMAILGIVGLGASYGLYSLLRKEELDLSFLEAKAETSPVFKLDDPKELSELPEKVKNEFTRFVQSNPAIKQEWYARGGTTDISLHVNNAVMSKMVVPEKNQRYAEAYKEFCVLASNFVMKRCGYESNNRLPIIILKDKSPSAEHISIVNSVVETYDIKFAVTQKGVESLQRALTLSQHSSQRGGFQIRMTVDKNNVYTPTIGPMTFTTTGEMYEVFETPFAETLHLIVSPTTISYITQVVGELKEEDRNEKFMMGIIGREMRVEEAVVHAVGHKLLEEFAGKYNLPITESQRKERIEFQKNSPDYRLIGRALDLVKAHGTDLISMYVKNPGPIRSALKD